MPFFPQQLEKFRNIAFFEFNSSLKDSQNKARVLIDQGFIWFKGQDVNEKTLNQANLDEAARQLNLAYQQPYAKPPLQLRDNYHSDFTIKPANLDGRYLGYLKDKIGISDEILNSMSLFDILTYNAACTIALEKAGHKLFYTDIRNVVVMLSVFSITPDQAIAALKEDVDAFKEHLSNLDTSFNHIFMKLGDVVGSEAFIELLKKAQQDESKCLSELESEEQALDKSMLEIKCSILNAHYIKIRQELSDLFSGSNGIQEMFPDNISEEEAESNILRINRLIQNKRDYANNRKELFDYIKDYKLLDERLTSVETGLFPEEDTHITLREFEQKNQMLLEHIEEAYVSVLKRKLKAQCDNLESKLNNSVNPAIKTLAQSLLLEIKVESSQQINSTWLTELIEDVDTLKLAIDSHKTGSDNSLASDICIEKGQNMLASKQNKKIAMGLVVFGVTLLLTSVLFASLIFGPVAPLAALTLFIGFKTLVVSLSLMGSAGLATSVFGFYGTIQNNAKIKNELQAFIKREKIGPDNPSIPSPSLS